MDGLITAAKNWGERCVHPDECFDHRMACLPDENNVTICVCNRFHEWNGTKVGCVQIYSVAYIMNETVTGEDHKEKLEKIQELMFRGPVYSIFFMIFVIAVCTTSIIIYCVYIRRKDNRLINEVHLLRESLNNRKRAIAGTSTTLC